MSQRIRINYNSRGASTITEQVVRMIHPRPRSFWSKWVEGLEAMRLEMSLNKATILEFYLNQIPYASNRRGVVQAARYYFNRDINTLNTKEMLALVVLVRAPSKFDLFQGKIKIEESISSLAKSMLSSKLLDQDSVNNLVNYELALETTTPPIEAFHFVDYVRKVSGHEFGRSHSKIITTLDGNLQQFVSDLLENRVKALSPRGISSASALVIDHKTGEVLAWASVGIGCKEENHQISGCKIDMVTSPRQPGSALKPFLYASALEKGWNANTIINDAPFSETVGNGIHHFHNYSHIYYDKVTLRVALGNSLNIPAIHTINYVSPKSYLSKLHDLGFLSLTKHADFYDNGLALGSGEVSLYELVQAYSVFPNNGKFKPLKITFYQDFPGREQQIYSEEVTSLIGNILSDPYARMLEFGRNSVLNLPTQTAVKTGTSKDYRDAMAVGYNHRYVVGIWMGNTDYKPTDGITGSLGPSLLLRGIFNELEKNSNTAPLYLSPKLIVKESCINVQDIENDNPNCPSRTEYFIANNQTDNKKLEYVQNQAIKICRPAKNLEMAIDPRVPRDKQVFEMAVSGILEDDQVEWIIDDKQYPLVTGNKFIWTTEKGSHKVTAKIWRDGKILATTEEHNFKVY